MPPATVEINEIRKDAFSAVLELTERYEKKYGAAELGTLFLAMAAAAVAGLGLSKDSMPGLTALWHELIAEYMNVLKKKERTTS